MDTRTSLAWDGMASVWDKIILIVTVTATVTVSVPCYRFLDFTLPDQTDQQLTMNESMINE